MAIQANSKTEEKVGGSTVMFGLLFSLRLNFRRHSKMLLAAENIPPNVLSCTCLPRIVSYEIKRIGP